jgi:hypothetical protein
MSLKDLFSNDVKKRPALGSGTDAVVEEFLEDENEEQPQPTEDDMALQQMAGQCGTPPAIDVRTVDRFVKIKGWRPVKNPQKSAGMWDNPEFLETLKTNFLSDKDQKKIWRSVADVYALSEGDGNAELTDFHSRLLAVKTLMKHSSTENKLEINERSIWAESRTTNKSIVRRPSDESVGKGIFARLFGR